MPAPDTFSWNEKLPAIVGRINPIISELNTQSVAIASLETEVTDLIGAGAGPDLTLIFENGLI